MQLMREARHAKEQELAVSKALASVRDVPNVRSNLAFVELRLLVDEEVHALFSLFAPFF